MGAGRHEIDVENDGSLRHRSMSGKGYAYPVGPAQPPQSQIPASAMERRRFVFLVPLIVLANVVVLVVTMYYNNCPKDKDVPHGHCLLHWLGRFSFQPWHENPLLGPSAHTLQKMGGLNSRLVTHDHQGWRLVSCIWLHAGVFHLLANMFGLLLIGLRLEQEFGFVRVGIVYLVSGFGGSLLSALFIQNEISVGASGALFGLLGATVSELLTNWTIYANKCLALTTLIVIVVINLGFGLMPHVDNFAHIGGFVSGFLLGFVFFVKPQYGWVNLRNLPAGYIDQDMPVKSKHTSCQYVFWVIAAVLLVLGFTAAIVSLFVGVDANKKCSWCHYLSCVNISDKWSCNSSSG